MRQVPLSCCGPGPSRQNLLGRIGSCSAAGRCPGVLQSVAAAVMVHSARGCLYLQTHERIITHVETAIWLAESWESRCWAPAVCQCVMAHHNITRACGDSTSTHRGSGFRTVVSQEATRHTATQGQLSAAGSSRAWASGTRMPCYSLLLSDGSMIDRQHWQNCNTSTHCAAVAEAHCATVSAMQDSSCRSTWP